MPRSGWVTPHTAERLSDHLAWGVVTGAYPPATVDEAIRASDRMQQRQRLLPARFVVYCVLGLAMFPEYSYEQVMRSLIAAQAWSDRGSPAQAVPTKAALYQARVRLGSEPLRRLFESRAHASTPERRTAEEFRGLHRLSVGVCHLRVPESPMNTEEFRLDDAQDATPSDRIGVVGLSNLATRTVAAVVLADNRRVESDLARELLRGRSLRKTLLHIDSRLFSPQLWSEAAETGAELLGRLPPALEPTVVRYNPDGSYYARDVAGTSLPVRVIEYVEPTSGERRRLATSLGPTEAPAAELLTLHRDRWRIGSAFDELQPGTGDPPVVLRSKNPEGVRQEVLGQLCVHHAVRWLLGVDAAPPTSAELK